MKKKHLVGLITVAILASLLCQTAFAEIRYLEYVTGDMTEAGYWTTGIENPDAVLADYTDIQAINASIYDTDACMMTDMSQIRKEYNAEATYRSLWATAFSEASGLMQVTHYDINNTIITGDRMNAILENIGGEDASSSATLKYGICVRRSDVIGLPSDLIATDEEGDVDYNFYQMSAVRVNEPVAIKAVSKDGKYFFCDTECVSGWIRSEDIAVCEDKEEWLDAWCFPAEEAIVVAEGKIYLEDSNINPVTSHVMLPMGTVLRRVSDDEYDASVTGRQPVYNYAVWLPIRQKDGSYSKTIALISKHYFVSEGYLPLTTNNILKVAFGKLGDTYGWGSMLNSVDCSNYIRDIYSCFGLSLARNTTWQSAMPVFKFNVANANIKEKKAVLDTLPPGAVLYFNGHEMMYLGHEEDNYYVISAVSNVKDMTTAEQVKLRTVVINVLDQPRPSGLTWLECLDTMLVPYLPGPEGGPEVIGTPDTDNSVSEAALKEELANADAAALRDAMNIHTDFHDKYFLHGDKGADFQKYIVLHDTSSYAAGDEVVSHWANSGDYQASHFLIDKDGSITQCLPLDKLAHHSGWGDKGNNEKFEVPEDGRDDRNGTQPSSIYSDYGMNSYSIGIALQHMDSEEGEEDEYTEEQLTALDQLIAYIDAYYGSESQIISHKDWLADSTDMSASFDAYLNLYQAYRQHTEPEAEAEEVTEETEEGSDEAVEEIVVSGTDLTDEERPENATVSGQAEAADTNPEAAATDNEKTGNAEVSEQTEAADADAEADATNDEMADADTDTPADGTDAKAVDEDTETADADLTEGEAETKDTAAKAKEKNAEAEGANEADQAENAKEDASDAAPVPGQTSEISGEASDLDEVTGDEKEAS